MTTGPVSQCFSCQRQWNPPQPDRDPMLGPYCAAFPDGIPDEIYTNVVDHREPYPGDHGLQWIARPGMTYPTVYKSWEDEPLTAAGQPVVGDNSGMVALLPSEAWAEANAVDDGLAPADMHVTLAYFDDTSAMSPDQRAAIVDACRAVADATAALEANGFAISLFNPTGDQPCIVLGLSGGEITDLQPAVETALTAAGVDLSAQHRPWIPHITLTYTDDHYMAADLVDHVGPVPLDRLRVAFADQVTDLPLTGGGATLTETAQTEEAPMQPVEDCPPGQHPMPDGTCMDDEQMPVEEYAADGAELADVTTSPEGYPLGNTETAPGFTSTGPGPEWFACAAVEGEWSNGKQFAPDALDWADTLPASLLWQPENDEGHDGSVVVGRIDGVMRSGPMIWAWGVFDDAGEYGKEAMRLVGGDFVTGVSIMADDMDLTDVELVCPAPVMPMVEPDGMDIGMDILSPEIGACESPKELIHHARLRTLTIVAEPNFPQCRIYLGPPPAELGLTMVAAAVGAHSTGTSTDPWDGPAAEKNLPSPMPVAKARAAYAWIDDAQIQGGQITKEASRFIHHNVSADGTPGAANLTACSTGIGVLNGGRGGTTVPGGDVQGIYDHLAAHLRDGDQEPPPLTAAGLTRTLIAAGHTITIPNVPPLEWFEPPVQTPPIGALHVTNQGQVYGYLAPAGVAHRAFRASGQTVTAPRRVDYTEFMNKTALAADGNGDVHRINAGNITFGCGHMSPLDPRRADPQAALDHYDNSCSVAARIRVGEDAHGTWVAGALLSSVDADTVERMMACALSGDWQAGKLNAALLVPVEGFPAAVSGNVRITAGAVVASSAPVVFTEPPTDAVVASADAVSTAAWDRLARGIGRDHRSKLNLLKARVDAAKGT